MANKHQTPNESPRNDESQGSESMVGTKPAGENKGTVIGGSKQTDPQGREIPQNGREQGNADPESSRRLRDVAEGSDADEAENE